MVQINNNNLLNNLREDCKIQNADLAPNQLAEKIVPVVIAQSKKYHRTNNVSCINATAATILTSSSTKKTFLTGYALSCLKDVTGTSILSYITFYDSLGNLSVLAGIAGKTLTIQSGQMMGNFPEAPIEVLKGSIIQLQNTTNVATTTAHATIYYYEEE